MCCCFFKQRGSAHEQSSDRSKPIYAPVRDQPVEWKASILTGTPYQVDAKALKSLQSPLSFQKRSAKTPHPGHFSASLSSNPNSITAKLNDVLSKPLCEEQSSARERIRKAFSSESTSWQPDLLIKVVPDLDLLLFDGALLGRIAVAWADLPTGKGFENRGLTMMDPLLLWKVQIQLNRASYLYASKQQVLGTLMHELMHAYSAVARGHAWFRKSKAEREVHEVAAALVNRLGVEGIEVGHLAS